MTNERYPALDGLRTIAMYGIVATHVDANLCAHPSYFPLFSEILNYSWNFVLLFMMISAFSMCCGYLQRFQTGNVSLEKFYGRRYKRILPFFALLTIIDVSICILQNQFHFTETVCCELWEAFANLTLLFGLIPGKYLSVVGVGWFLGIIFFFYLLFPFYSTLLSTKRRAWMAFLISIVWGFAISKYFAPIKGVASDHSSMLVVAPYFVSAGLIYVYKGEIQNFIVQYRKWLFKILTLFYTFIFFLFPNCRFDYSNLLLYALWLIYAIVENPIKKSLLNNSFMAFMSGISLEVYLSHMMFFRIVEKFGLEHYLTNNNMLYFTTFAIVSIMAVSFSLVWKKIVQRFVK